MLARQALDRIGAAERLEALEREAVALVLVEQLGDAGLGSDRRQPAKRRRRIAGPGPDGVPGGAALLGREDVPLLGSVRRVAVEAWVRDEDGRQGETHIHHRAAAVEARSSRTAAMPAPSRARASWRWHRAACWMHP